MILKPRVFFIVVIAVILFDGISGNKKEGGSAADGYATSSSGSIAPAALRSAASGSATDGYATSKSGFSKPSALRESSGAVGGNAGGNAPSVGGKRPATEEDLKKLAEIPMSIGRTAMDIYEGTRECDVGQIDAEKKKTWKEKLVQIKNKVLSQKAGDDIAVTVENDEFDKFAEKLLGLRAQLLISVDILLKSSTDANQRCINETISLISRVTELCTNDESIEMYFRVGNCVSVQTRKETIAVLKPLIKIILLVAKPLAKDLFKSLLSDVSDSWKSTQALKDKNIVITPKQYLQMQQNVQRDMKEEIDKRFSPPSQTQTSKPVTQNNK